MNRTIRRTFSSFFSRPHGQIRNPSAPISRFLCTNTQKPLHSWLYAKKLLSKKHGVTPLSDHFRLSKNQERELHEQKEVHTDIPEDDEFNELGPSVPSPPKTNFTSSQQVPKKEGKGIGTPMAYGDGKASMMNHQDEDGNIKNRSAFADLVSVAIDNVPMGVNSGQLREAMCAFGDVKAITSAAGYNGLSSYHVEFKNRESRDTALRVGEVITGSNILRINCINAPRLLRIRTNKVDPGMTELAMHRMLSSFGHVVGLVSPSDGAIDVFIKVDGGIEAQKLLNRLDTNMVREVELLHPKTAVNSGCKKSEQLFERQLGEIREHLHLQLIYLEDLEHLHSAISHIKAHRYPIHNNT